MQCKLLKASVKFVNVSLTPEAKLNQTLVIFWIKQVGSNPLDQTVDCDLVATPRFNFKGMHKWSNVYIEYNVSRFWIKASSKYKNVDAYINAFTKDWLWKFWQSEWFESNFGQLFFLFLKSCSRSLTPYFPVYIKGQTKFVQTCALLSQLKFATSMM